MSGRRRLTKSKSATEYRRNRTAIVSFILILIILGVESACRCTESEFICKTIYTGEYGSHRITDSEEILRNPVQKFYTGETLIDRIKLCGKEGQVIYQRFKKKGSGSRTFRPELSDCFLCFCVTRRLYNSCTPFIIYFWLSLFSIIIYIHCQDGKKRSLQLSLE